jgi:hypothetical protein
MVVDSVRRRAGRPVGGMVEKTAEGLRLWQMGLAI